MFPYATGSEIPADYRDYMYGKFSRSDGSTFFLGTPWVKESSIIENDSPSYIMTLLNPTPQQVESLRQMAVASGIENFKIEMI